ncbi:outer membrane protein OmpA-like peptidoglycan-associated protein [Blastococcus colisei]|uniref:Outer membrane protein OmpA-like peptidoglycan-associated protein n=1 Tax=Blastococcus colisei TaxID=1564162 RepID=A0A543PDK4_9ACTN|nr:OmpA family protein [Blastococcus colisei]TQN42127.1 outer membrane protein OmpA-like peptidoglycan-associated protein [Blastococcus colisei]
MNAPSALRRIAAGVVSIALLVGTAACSDGAEPTGGLSIVVGARNNMPAPALSGAASEAIESALVSQSHLSVVVADGAPFQLDGAGALVARDENSIVQKQDRDQNRELIERALGEAQAKTEETDLLAALLLAARSLSSVDGEVTIVIVDSGLSTTGALNFAAQPELLDADPETLAAALAEAGELPDLSGVDVVFSGLGDVVAPQEPLPAAQRANLIAIWTAIVKTAAAPNVRVEEAPLSETPARGLPRVTPVVPGEGSRCVVETVVLDEGDIAFVADTAEFQDGDAALATLQPIAQRMTSQVLSATLTGTTADKGDDEGQRALSRQRAQGVADVLVELGVPVGRMTVTGVGSDFPDYDPTDLPANRAVRIQLAGVAEMEC